MSDLLDVTAGRSIAFTADSRPMLGVILHSQQFSSVHARIVVECDESVKVGARLGLVEFPAARRCGQAHPETLNGHTVVVLSVPYSHIDLATVES